MCETPPQQHQPITITSEEEEEEQELEEVVEGCSSWITDTNASFVQGLSPMAEPLVVT